ncbi:MULTISPECIES: hypothetical protein [Bacillus]|uniref:hypothetical protein n=1 Tax=Bacillus TaxID=1386 RepID=UPI001E5FB7E1|nr:MULTISPECIES: hypothetical protein [Bacillus]MEC0952463.1 hypothetical protein [Bacillus velezensis]MED3707087.1 hypothetical protein [Bacillus velezensis]
MSDRKLTEDKFDNRLTEFAPFISPNPVTSFKPVQRYPKIDKTSFISPFSSVIGDVRIKDNVYVAPNSAIREMKEHPFILVQIQIFKTESFYMVC